MFQKRLVSKRGGGRFGENYDILPRIRSVKAVWQRHRKTHRSVSITRVRSRCQSCAMPSGDSMCWPMFSKAIVLNKTSDATELLDNESRFDITNSQTLQVHHPFTEWIWRNEYFVANLGSWRHRIDDERTAKGWGGGCSQT